MKPHIGYIGQKPVKNPGQWEEVFNKIAEDWTSDSLSYMRYSLGLDGRCCSVENKPFEQL